MIGDKIKELRKAKGLTQEDLAKIIGVERSSIGKYESKHPAIPSDDVKKRLADFFGVSLDYLCDMGTTEKKPTPVTDRDRLASEVTEKLMQLRPEKQNEALFYIEYLLKTDRPDEGPHQ